MVLVIVVFFKVLLAVRQDLLLLQLKAAAQALAQRRRPAIRYRWTLFLLRVPAFLEGIIDRGLIWRLTLAGKLCVLIRHDAALCPLVQCFCDIGHFLDCC